MKALVLRNSLFLTLVQLLALLLVNDSARAWNQVKEGRVTVSINKNFDSAWYGPKSRYAARWVTGPDTIICTGETRSKKPVSIVSAQQFTAEISRSETYELMETLTSGRVQKTSQVEAEAADQADRTLLKRSKEYRTASKRYLSFLVDYHRVKFQTPEHISEMKVLAQTMADMRAPLIAKTLDQEIVSHESIGTQASIEFNLNFQNDTLMIKCTDVGRPGKSVDGSKLNTALESWGMTVPIEPLGPES